LGEGNLSGPGRTKKGSSFNRPSRVARQVYVEKRAIGVPAPRGNDRGRFCEIRVSGQERKCSAGGEGGMWGGGGGRGGRGGVGLGCELVHERVLDPGRRAAKCEGVGWHRRGDLAGTEQAQKALVGEEGLGKGSAEGGE